MQVEGPFFNLTGAAQYCGYESPEHFSELLRGFVVPKFGPKKNRYAKSVLDAWMANPDAFKVEKKSGRPYKPRLVTA